jgi:hypothetical protein
VFVLSLSCLPDLPPGSLSAIHPSESPYLRYKAPFTSHSHIPALIHRPKIQTQVFLWQNCWLS